MNEPFDFDDEPAPRPSPRKWTPEEAAAERVRRGVPVKPPAKEKGLIEMAVPYVLIGAFLGATAMVLPSVIISQAWPVFGGVFEKMAEPWSPLKKSLIPIHLFVFCFLGAAAGAVAGALLFLSISRR
jgi:hypothetical protein